MDVSNYSVRLGYIIIAAFLAICLISYYILFKDHHKRNELKFYEIYPLVIKYIILCIFSVFLIIFGISRIIEGYVYNEEIYEVIAEFAVGFTTIIVVILNFIFFVKRHRVDLIKEEREAEEENTNNIAEIIEFVILIGMIIISVFNMYRQINFRDITNQLKELFTSIMLIVASVFLMFTLNPLDVKGKVKNIFDKDKNKDKEKVKVKDKDSKKNS